MNPLYFIFFLSIVSSIYIGMHYYVYTRIVYGLLIAAPFITYLRLFFWLAGASFFVGEFLSRRMSGTLPNTVTDLGHTWLGIISISLSTFIVADLLRIFFRTQQFRYFSTIGALILILLATAYSLYNISHYLVVKEIKLKIEKLPEELSGFRVVQISDIHFDLTTSPERVRKMVDLVNKQNPDLVLMTGDLLDGRICEVNGICDELKKIKSKYGFYGVTGNHEFYAGIPNFLEVAQNSGMTVLRGENVLIAGNIELVGIDDTEVERFTGKKLDMSKAFSTPQAVDAKKPIILMSHRAHLFDEAVKLGTDLQLSGHYHVGQIPPLDLVVMLYYKYPYGLYKKGSSYLYVTSGTGWWGPPMRLFSKSEIVTFVMEK
jgi:uncharacterized protein